MLTFETQIRSGQKCHVISPVTPQLSYQVISWIIRLGCRHLAARLEEK
jgi:hypothetical protein